MLSNQLFDKKTWVTWICYFIAFFIGVNITLNVCYFVANVVLKIVCLDYRFLVIIKI